MGFGLGAVFLAFAVKELSDDSDTADLYKKVVTPVEERASENGAQDLSQVERDSTSDTLPAVLEQTFD